MLLIDEKQDLTFTRRRKKIPIPITNKISSSRISDELRVLKVMPCKETKSDPL